MRFANSIKTLLATIVVASLAVACGGETTDPSGPNAPGVNNPDPNDPGHQGCEPNCETPIKTITRALVPSVPIPPGSEVWLDGDGTGIMVKAEGSTMVTADEGIHLVEIRKERGLVARGGYTLFSTGTADKPIDRTFPNLEGDWKVTGSSSSHSGVTIRWNHPLDSNCQTGVLVGGPWNWFCLHHDAIVTWCAERSQAEEADGEINACAAPAHSDCSGRFVEYGRVIIDPNGIYGARIEGMVTDHAMSGCAPFSYSQRVPAWQ